MVPFDRNPPMQLGKNYQLKEIENFEMVVKCAKRAIASDLQQFEESVKQSRG